MQRYIFINYGIIIRAGRWKNGKCYRLYTGDDKLKQKNISERQRYIFINYIDVELL
jgi:hypothetical protein